MDNNLTSHEITTLTGLYPTLGVARDLLVRAGLPNRVIDRLPGDGEALWQQVAAALSAGVAHAGRALLLDEVRKEYPASPMFDAAADTRPSVGRDSYVANDHGTVTVLHDSTVNVIGSGSNVGGTGSVRPTSPTRKPLKVFFVGAAPFDIELDRLRADREFRAIQRVCRPDLVTVVNRTAATVDDLAGLLDERPDILHLAAHTKDDTLLFEDPAGEPHPVPVSALLARMRIYRDRAGFRVAGIVFSVCDGHAFSADFAEVTDTVVTWRGDIDDDCAIAFAGELYRALGRQPRPTLRAAAELAAFEVGEKEKPCAGLDQLLSIFPL